jgi:SNF2 family DNA or RNA helicase
MLSLKDFHPYQHRAIDFIVHNKRSMMWLFMGAGKTALALTAFSRLQDVMQTYRALVIAPRRVAETVWRQEAEKWSHLRGLRVILLRGSEDKKLRDLHRKDHDIAVINYESIPWLVRAVNNEFLSHGRYPPWNMLVLDEIDRLKNSTGKRFQMVEKIFPYFTNRVGLTGTPASNGYGDLHGQYLCIDDGKRLYKNLGDFRTKWMKAGYADLSWEVRPEAKDEIEARIQDITLSMSAEDYLKLPDYIYHHHTIDLDPKIQEQYDSLEQEMFAQLDRHVEDPIDGEWTMEVHSALSARAKCRQLANGAVLNPDNSGTVMLVHDAKLEMLDSIVHEAAGNPILLAYMFRHDMHRIKARYEKEGYRIGYIGPGTKDIENVVAQWNAKRYHILMSHPASAGLGLNLQDGGNELVWFSPTDNLTYYQQMNARLRRQGQTAPNVNIRLIIARNTIDEPLVKLLERKAATAEELRQAIEEYRKTK